MQNHEDLIEALEQVGEEYARFIGAQPEAAFQHRPAPGEWSAAEATGHLAESLVWNCGRALLVAQHPGWRIGRELDDPARLEPARRMAGATPAEGARAVRNAIQQAAATLREIPSEGWQSRGQHLRRGDLSVTEIVELILIAHCRDHLAQAQAAIALHNP